MLGKLSGWDDTIVALATPNGIGAIGVIRLSGAKAIEITNQLFPSKDLNKQNSHTIHVGFLKEGNKSLDFVRYPFLKSHPHYSIAKKGCRLYFYRWISGSVWRSKRKKIPDQKPKRIIAFHFSKENE